MARSAVDRGRSAADRAARARAGLWGRGLGLWGAAWITLAAAGQDAPPRPSWCEVEVALPGVGAADVDRQVAVPLARELGRAGFAAELRSVDGLARARVVSAGTNENPSLILAQALRDWAVPPGATAPELHGPFASIKEWTLRGKDAYVTAAAWEQVRSSVSLVPHVASAEACGLSEEVLAIRLDPGALSAADWTPAEAMEAIGTALAELPRLSAPGAGGLAGLSVGRGGQRLALDTLGSIVSIAAVRGGRAFQPVGECAEVWIGEMPGATAKTSAELLDVLTEEQVRLTERDVALRPVATGADARAAAVVDVEFAPRPLHAVDELASTLGEAARDAGAESWTVVFATAEQIALMERPVHEARLTVALSGDAAAAAEALLESLRRRVGITVRRFTASAGGEGLGPETSEWVFLGADLASLGAACVELAAALAARPQAGTVVRVGAPQARVLEFEPDPARVEAVGLTVEGLRTVLQQLRHGRTFGAVRVLAEAPDAEAMGRWRVRATNGDAVPVAELGTWRETLRPLSIERDGDLMRLGVTWVAVPGVDLTELRGEAQRIAEEQGLALQPQE
ncbi:MAG: hypothetical protein AAF628_35145 [Planctomycetota bacterium]